MKLLLGLINLHLCVLVPVIIHFINPGLNLFFLVCVWFLSYILIYYSSIKNV